jgi:hypothetical protein
MTEPAWKEIETSLRQIYSLPHNRVRFMESRPSVESEIDKKLEELKSGISGVPRKEEFVGPKMFLRVVGAANRLYSGEWWFDASILEGFERAYSRLVFNDRELKAVVRDMLREVLAISTEWNRIEEVWALELPAGERLTGFSGIGTPQKLFGSLPLSEKGNRLLVGRTRQIFFPVKNPLWVSRFRNLA